MMKILLLADAASFHTERFFNETKRQGCQTILASLETGIPDTIKLEKNGFIKQLYYSRAVSQIKKLIEEIQPDIISAHFASGYGHIAALANKSFQIPLALNLWGSDIFIVPHKSILHKKKTIFALKHADYLFADSRFLLDTAQRLYPFKNSKVIPWGVEESLLTIKENIDSNQLPLKIIVPRMHEEVYNNLFIVESLKEFIKRDTIQITFPDFGSLTENFKERCNELVGDKIKFYKKSKRESFLEIFASHDFYLSASLSDSSPVSLIEAMAIGLVPIVHNINGVREWATEQNSFLFENNNHSLYTCIDSILQSQIDFTSMIKKNKQQVRERAIFTKNISDQLEIFQMLINTK